MSMSDTRGPIENEGSIVPVPTATRDLIVKNT